MRPPSKLLTFQKKFQDRPKPKALRLKQGSALGNKSTRDRGFVLVALTESSQGTQALAASPSDSGTRRTLIYGAATIAANSIAISGGGWPNEPRFVCKADDGACGKRGAALRRSVLLRGSPWIRPGFTNISARSPTRSAIPRSRGSRCSRRPALRPPLTAGSRAINNLLTGEGALPDCREVESPLPGNLETGGQ